jgi:hypothetical protein
MYRAVFLILILFSACCAGILLTPLPVGWQFLICVLLFALLMGGFSFQNRRRWPELWSIWAFATLVSPFQVLPDWFLSAVLGVLVFPEDGLFKIGTVSAYMAGLWAIPFFLILMVGRLWHKNQDGIQWLQSGTQGGVALACAVAALIIFASSEATLWVLGSWFARDVHMIGHVALYVLLPEMLLGAHLYWAFIKSRGRALPIQIGYAFHVSLAYTGALALSYLFIEKVA